MKLTQSFILILLMALLLGCSENHKKSLLKIENGNIGMIGYGSLMSKNSMEKTLKRTYEDSVYLVHLEGYQRAWNHLIPMTNANRDFFYLRENDTIPIYNRVALNIMASEHEKMNCVLFFITPEELAQFDERERGYKRIDVTDKIKEFRFKGGRVYAYKSDEYHTYNYKNKDNTVLPQSYFKLVTNACDSIGKEFRQEFDSSTNHLDKATILSREDVFWIDSPKVF